MFIFKVVVQATLFTFVTESLSDSRAADAKLKFELRVPFDWVPITLDVPEQTSVAVFQDPALQAVKVIWGTLFLALLGSLVSIT